MEGLQTWGSPALEAEARYARFYYACEVSAAFIRARYPTALLGWGNRNGGTRPADAIRVSANEIARARFDGLINESDRVFRELRFMRRRLQEAVRALPFDQRQRAKRAINALARRMKNAD